MNKKIMAIIIGGVVIVAIGIFAVPVMANGICHSRGSEANTESACCQEGTPPPSVSGGCCGK
jgi:hypothetical protein